VSRGRASRLAAGLSATGLLAGAFLLPPGKPLPFDLCLLHRLTGIPCLTCGLTRAVCLFARGDWRSSLSMHPAGGLVFAGLAVACVWLLAEAVAERDLGAGLRRRLLGLALGTGGALSVLAWGARLAGILPGV
jgi:Protein of unknown function (DUF2752)